MFSYNISLRIYYTMTTFKLIFFKILVSNGIGIPIFFFSESKLIHPIQLFFISYTTVGILLFMTLGWIISSMLQILSRRIHLIAFGDGRWGRCFSLIAESVDHLNRCFGMILLSFLVFFFIPECT